MAHGEPYKEIAGMLSISWQTIKNYIMSIRDKLEIENRLIQSLRQLK